MQGHIKLKMFHIGVFLKIEGCGGVLVILHLGKYGMLLGLSVPLAGVARFA